MSLKGGAHERLIESLCRFAILGEEDCEAIRAVQLQEREFAASTYLIREGQNPQRCDLLLEGFAYRQKLTVVGQRSIVGLLVPGDLIDAQNLFLEESDHDVLALTRARVVEIAINDLRHLADTSPTINRALWRSGLVEASIFREWLLNIGRRDSNERVAHLLCEISTRLQVAGMTQQSIYELPMTQEQLGDALGLTAVHINRVLKRLEKEGLLLRQRREVAIVDWQRLRRLADFNDRYLHVGSSARSRH